MAENVSSPVANLPEEIYGNRPIRYCQGVWHLEPLVPALTKVQQGFNARPTDVLLSSLPKSGSTWLKALLFATINRAHLRPSDPSHPLRSSHPQDCVPFIEEVIGRGRASELEALPSPRVATTHLPYQHLPPSVASSACKIVYICREPKDTLVSSWHFVRATPFMGQAVGTEAFPFDEAFDKCCKGIVPYGPMWDHWLGYWKESLRTPSRVLFLKYEDVIQDGVGNLKVLAEFVGCPFSREEEEEEGLVEEIVRLCSFEKLSSLEVNKTGSRNNQKNSAYFRKGKVGEWKNQFTSEMAQRLDEIVEEKLSGSGLSFRSVEPTSSNEYQ